MLESHHKKLAEILRFQHEHPSSAAVAETASSPATTPGLNSQRTKTTAWSQDTQQHLPRLPGINRMPARETSSSIASNLASARGIPSHPRRASPASPTLSSQQAGAKMTESPGKTKTGESRLRGTQAYASKDRPSRVSAPKQPWSPPNVSPTEITSQQVIPAYAVDSGRQKGRISITEEPFQRFYSTFGGLISKLSAPLAFAGLPLGTGTPEPSSQTDVIKRKSSADTRLDHHQAIPDRSSTSTEPDVNRLFSKAALRAVRDGNGGTGSTAESFYVVPTTGGTVSYAGILSRAEKEARRNSGDEGDEDFVDARETPSSPELRQSMVGTKGKTRRSGESKLTSLQNPKTLEELQMENQALKHLSDTLSKRLHMWEVNAQSSSIALQQSLRAMHYQSPEHQPPPSGSTATSPITPPPAAPSVTDHEQRVKDLEELVRSGEKDLEQAGRENKKLRSDLGKWNERWEKLKEGAKTRRAGTQAAASQRQQQQQQQEQSKSNETAASPSASPSPGPAPGPSTNDKKEPVDPKPQEDPETTPTKTETNTGNASGNDNGNVAPDSGPKDSSDS